jgi:hypothetical protein
LSEQDDKDHKLERLLTAAQNWCGSYLEAANSPEEVPRVVGRHMYNKAALQDALDAYPRDK